MSLPRSFVATSRGVLAKRYDPSGPGVPYGASGFLSRSAAARMAAATASLLSITRTASSSVDSMRASGHARIRIGYNGLAGSAMGENRPSNSEATLCAIAGVEAPPHERASESNNAAFVKRALRERGGGLCGTP